MFKVTPNPPDTDPASPYDSIDSNKLHETAERKGQLFSVCPDINTQSLLANASEDLLSISAIAAGFLPARTTATHRRP